MPNERFGVAAAVVHTFSRMAATIAVAVGVALVGGFEVGDPISDFDPFFLLLAGLGVASALVSLGIDTRQDAPPTPDGRTRSTSPGYRSAP